jgi:putative hydrolase of the HAD superfamily
MNAILFDLDNTLTHRDDSIRVYAEAFVSYYSNAFKKTVEVDWLAENIITIDQGGYGGHAARCAMISQFDIWAASSPSEEQLLEHWFSHFSHCPVPMPALHDTLNELKAAGFKLGIITNGKSDGQRDKIRALGIEPLFDSIVASGDINIKKPDPRIFTTALQQLGCEPHQAIFVGDHPINDYVGAQAVGMTPIWLRGFNEWPQEQALPTRIIDTLADVVFQVRDIAATNNTFASDRKG